MPPATRGAALGATLQIAVMIGLQAAVDRAGATVTRRSTGTPAVVGAQGRDRVP